LSEGHNHFIDRSKESKDTCAGDEYETLVLILGFFDLPPRNGTVLLKVFELCKNSLRIFKELLFKYE